MTDTNTARTKRRLHLMSRVQGFLEQRASSARRRASYRQIK